MYGHNNLCKSKSTVSDCSEIPRNREVVTKWRHKITQGFDKFPGFSQYCKLQKHVLFELTLESVAL